MPLNLISFASQDKLAIIVGLEGWTPVVVSPREILQAGSETAQSLRVASNGFIIDFTAQTVDGELVGYFRNVVTGTQGEWRARPARKS